MKKLIIFCLIATINISVAFANDTKKPCENNTDTFCKDGMKKIEIDFDALDKKMNQDKKDDNSENKEKKEHKSEKAPNDKH
ncbi:MAG: hypothetical protein BWY78_00024 [Alphaproteobacteria bacterium ADurb.Bin438]|nr:MAG: hypothetical protein BWY78_00024 [Alphaproteobacteria bacterium ADurb.Bin438]